MLCPDCSGRGEVRVSHVRYAHGGGASNVPMRCFRCRGKGEVDAQTLEWIALGQRMRDARVNVQPYRTLRAEAVRRGMSPSHLSAMEQGNIEPVPAEDFAEREASVKPAV